MANQDHVELLKQGVAQWNEWREQHPQIQPDLRGADLSRANPSDAYRTPADFASVNLRKADLSNADLSFANLSQADLSQANFRQTCLEHADLSNANLMDALQPHFLN